MPRGKRDLKYTWTCRLEVEVFFRGQRRERENFPRSQEVEESIAGSREVVLQEVKKSSNLYATKLAGIFFVVLQEIFLAEECEMR